MTPHHAVSTHGRIGIRDVAAAAGVSITTVSDALNGKGRLPDGTRNHVREVADRLGYRPSAAARTLRTGRSGLLGLTSAGAADPFAATESAWFAPLVQGATATALDHGYALVVLPVSSRHDVWGNITLDGVVVVDPAAGDPIAADLLKGGTAVVSVHAGAGAPLRPGPGGVQAVELLVEMIEHRAAGKNHSLPAQRPAPVRLAVDTGA